MAGEEEVVRSQRADQDPSMTFSRSRGAADYLLEPDANAQLRLKPVSAKPLYPLPREVGRRADATAAPPLELPGPNR